MNKTLPRVKQIINHYIYSVGYAQVICDNDELFNDLINQLVLPDVHEGKREWCLVDGVDKFFRIGL